MKKIALTAVVAISLLATASYAQDGPVEKKKDRKSDKKEVKMEKKQEEGKDRKAFKKQQKMEKKDNKAEMKDDQHK